MNTFRPEQHPCVTCGKQSGILTCEGCRLTFCKRHVVRHREDLSDQLENLLEDQHQFHEKLSRLSSQSNHLQRIDQWEKESIRRIRLAAETARNDLRQTIETSKRRLSKLSQQLATTLMSSYQTENFSEIDLTRWKKQLKDLRLEMNLVNAIEFNEDKQPAVHFLRVRNVFSSSMESNRTHVKAETHEAFVTGHHSVVVGNSGMLIRHKGDDLDCGYVLGRQVYSQGRHTLTFRIEQCSTPYMIFFGCISTRRTEKTISHSLPSVVGWFGYNEVYQHGTWNNNMKIHGYESNLIQSKDLINLIFDCDKKCIELFHHRTNKLFRLTVNIDKAPLPWQLLVILTHTDDCVSLLNVK